jgi:acyl-CoA reductase-like NAD-dependent aldehyde dehydrogenase
MTKIAKMPMTIDGLGVTSANQLFVTDPATEQVTASVPDCSHEQLDEAVHAARQALPRWSSSPLTERQQSLRAFADLLEDNIESLADLLTSEQGKPLSDAKAEIMIAVRRCHGTATLAIPSEIRNVSPNRQVMVNHVAIGVVGAIAPWNFPISLAMAKVAQATVTGNTVILKPSPLTPVTTLKIGELAKEVFPPGVFNVISGGDLLGPWMTEHPGIDKISFTGSTETGRRVLRSAASTLKRVTLELGGNDAAIVFPDVDIDAVAHSLFWAAFRNAGQICIAVKRIYVHSEIYERFLASFLEVGRTVRVGPGRDVRSQIGPVQNKSQFERVVNLIEDSQRAGHRLTIASPAPEGPGYFLPLTVVENPPDDARIVVEEQFGPVVPIMKFENAAEVVERVNATDFGLGGSIWSANEALGLSLANQIQSGTVWVNEIQQISAEFPFGGHKQSGLGAEGGWEGLMAYTNPKVTTIARTPTASE